MNDAQRKALESAGWQLGSVEDFLGLSQPEVQLIDLRISVIDAVKRVRTREGLTQRQLAARLGTSQPRVAKIESPAAADVSLDQLFQALFAAGGTLDDLEGLPAGVTGPKVSGRNGDGRVSRPIRRAKATRSRQR